MLDVAFKYPWRLYQKRVLDEIDEHLKDSHLHVIAPPGSGKTVLGLEVMRRLGKPALILAPTITIRDQWIDRFLKLFTGSQASWFSTDIRKPGMITCVTYQGLHMASDSDIPALLKQQQVETIIADEAHHLRTAWWLSLMDLKKKMDAKIVALTATPPYDASPLEWQRYREFCGPVDAEISVPELVREKNLCPHQDYVYFSLPEGRERELIRKFTAGVKEIQSALKEEEMIRFVEDLSQVKEPQLNEEAILDDPAFSSSLAIYLSSVGRPPKGLMKVIGGWKAPPFSLSWHEIMLSGLLKRDILPEKILVLLKKNACIERRRIMLRRNKQIDALLTRSSTKLRSIDEIVRSEHEVMKDSMRCLILTDFIRKDSLVRPSKKLGAVPIFQTIKDQPVHIAVLTGSLIIVEKSLKDHIPGRSKPLDDRYVIIEPKDRQVHTVTRLFTEGRINVLIGTAALLGEGWDAPCINTLILASYVGSYMLSNQMRGRAIRTDSGKPKKTANIWHLVSVDASLRGAGTDFEVLHRRFRSFVGISSAGQTIESGITRLDLTPPPYFSLKVRSMNKQAIELSRKRDDLLERWNSSVLRPGAQMVQQVRTRKFRSPRSMIFRNTIRALFLQAVTWGTFFLDIYYNNAHRFSGEGFFIFSAVLLAITGIAFLPGAIRCLILTIRHHSLERSMMTLGLAVLEALCRDGEIWTKASKFEIKAIEDKRGYCHLHITGGTTYEKSVFLDALQDVLDPIMNPRYLIARKSAFMKEDYYSVPEKLSDNKKSAERFLEEWQGYVGPGKLVYTRTAEGRRTLLRARGNALSSNFRTKSQRVSVWT